LLGWHTRQPPAFPVEIVRRVRAAVGSDFIICYRMSMADYVEEGQSWDEIVTLAIELERAGVTIITPGSAGTRRGCQRSSHQCPTAPCRHQRRRRRTRTRTGGGVQPINMPQAAEQILAETRVQLISMARPLLSDPEWVRKAQDDRSAEINTCIACNQACLDHAFAKKMVSCLLNPERARDATGVVTHPERPQGSRRGGGSGRTGRGPRRRPAWPPRHSVRGQRLRRRPVRSGRRIPGKEELAKTIRYFATMLDKHGVVVRAGHPRLRR